MQSGSRKPLFSHGCKLLLKALVPLWVTADTTPFNSTKKMCSNHTAVHAISCRCPHTLFCSSSRSARHSNPQGQHSGIVFGDNLERRQTSSKKVLLLFSDEGRLQHYVGVSLGHCLMKKLFCYVSDL